MGVTTKRADALRLFNLKSSNPDYPGATFPEIARAFVSAAPVICRWKRYQRFRFASISKLLRAQFRITGCATLLAFAATHKNGIWRCIHVVVAVDATDYLIDIIDPLGKEPPALARGNVRLQLVEGPGGICVVGNSYSVNLGAEAFVLQWKSKNNSAQIVSSFADGDE
ncbi:MAG TPA: hypothetical protein VIW64_01345 [Pyrinomonadaceae bacterium]